MTPVVSIVGKSNVGKTTLLERLVVEIKRRGYCVATIKHDVHGFDIDKPGKDSWRHAQAGSDAVVISSPQKLALIKKVDHDSSLDEILQLVGPNFDIILTEGFKQSHAPKVEVHRKEIGGELLCRPADLIAIATDEPLDSVAPQYGLDDAQGLTDLLEERFLKIETQEEAATLFVDAVHIPLTTFAQSIISKTVKGMVSSLRGVNSPRDVSISVTGKSRGSDKQ